MTQAQDLARQGNYGSPQDYYNATGNFYGPVDPNDPNFNGGTQLVDSQGRPWVSNDISGPPMLMVDAQHATADHPVGSLIGFNSPERQSVYRDMPQAGLREFLSNVAVVAAPAVAGALGAYGVAGGAEAGVGTGAGAGAAEGIGASGGAGGGGSVLGASGAFDPALTSAAYSGMGATGLGSTAAGLGTGEAGLLAAGSGLPVAEGLAGGASGLGGGFTAQQLTQGLSGAGTIANSAGGGNLTSTQGSTFGIPNNVLGGIATGVGGLLGANATGDAMKDVASQYLALGAPSRARLEQSYQPGFDLFGSDPGLQNSLDTTANTTARALSTKYGNPADSPTAQAEMNKYLLGNVYLPQLNTYRSQQMTGGGLGLNTAGTGSLAGAQSTGQGYEAVGAGLGQALNPTTSLADLYKQFGLGGGNSNYKLNVGGLTL